MIVTRSVRSPIGPLLVVGDGEHVRGLYMTDHRRAPVLGEAVVDEEAFPDAARQLSEWFAGRRTTFDLKLDAVGTPFQRQVWDVLVGIPFGETMSYGQVASLAGCPGSARAVGHAVARNPVSIVVPCHRVVGARGVLTGYAGGLDNKRWLLEHERSLTMRTGNMM